MSSPDTRRKIAAVVARLLLHYYVPGELSDSARKAMAEDWVEDLEEFPPAIVAEACREWRRRPNGRRPLPGDIRMLCIAEQREQQEHRALTGPSDMDAYARSVGFANNAERMEAIRHDVAKRDDPAHFERLEQIEQKLNARRAGTLRPIKEISPEALREARIQLGLEPPAEAAE